jgi:hypothetical protein
VKKIATVGELKAQLMKIRVDAYKLADRLEAVRESGLVPPPRSENDISDLTVCMVRATTEALASLKLQVANFQGDLPFGTTSAIDVARGVVADCKNGSGEFYEVGLVRAISDIVVLLYKAQGRLPLYKNVVTGEVHEW